MSDLNRSLLALHLATEMTPDELTDLRDWFAWVWAGGGK